MELKIDSMRINKMYAINLMRFIQLLYLDSRLVAFLPHTQLKVDVVYMFRFVYVIQ
jgi:hypothetical protein